MKVGCKGVYITRTCIHDVLFGSCPKGENSIKLPHIDDPCVALATDLKAWLEQNQ